MRWLSIQGDAGKSQPRAASRPHLMQPRDIAGQRVDLKIDQIAQLYPAPCRHLLRVWNDIDAKVRARDLIDGQRGAIECHRPFRRDEFGQIRGGLKCQAGAVTLLAHFGDLRHAIDMARHDMPAQLVAQPQSTFEVEPFAQLPRADVGLGHALGGDFHVKPILRLRLMFGPKRNHRQTDAITGNRRADVDPVHIIRTADPRPQITALFQLKHPTNIRDNPREHADLPVFLSPYAPDNLCPSALQVTAQRPTPPNFHRIAWIFMGKRGSTLFPVPEVMPQTPPPSPSKPRVFLMLQGPHGPFFWGLGKMLEDAGSIVWRVGFNAGDRAFWFSRNSFLPYTAPPADWPTRFEAIVREKSVTDIVLYGDTRPIHAQAIERARALGITIHVFEEGYIRPYWVTYERNGSNGHSTLMDMSVAKMKAALPKPPPEPIPTPAHWGDMRQHIFYGALYHWFVMFRNGAFPHFTRHRDLPVSKEFRLYFKRLIFMPLHHLSREWHTRRILANGHPFHIALLQLEHDASFQIHSPYTTILEFIKDVIEGFAQGAPAHHHLVFKAHPLETDRHNLRHEVRRIATKHGVHSRVHYVRGGKLQKLLQEARSAVTVNSTAGQQALSLGLPLKIFGQAVYDKPEFTSHQPLSDFFADPKRPDNAAYQKYRQFLLKTSQRPGGFYSRRGRRLLLRQLVDLMLAAKAPEEALLNRLAHAQHFTPPTKRQVIQSPAADLRPNKPPSSRKIM